MPSHPEQDMGREKDIAAKLAEAQRLASESRLGEVRALVADLRAAHPLPGPPLDVEIALVLARAASNAGQAMVAEAELDRVRHLVPILSVGNQGRYHALAGVVADRLGEDERAVDEAMLARELLDAEPETTFELATAYGGCATTLADVQLYPLADEAIRTVISRCEAADLPTGRLCLQGAYVCVTWGLRLDHLNLPTERDEQWLRGFELVDEGIAAGGAPRLWVVQAEVQKAMCAARLGDTEGARQTLASATSRLPQSIAPITRHRIEHAEGAVLLAEGDLCGAHAILRRLWTRIAEDFPPPWNTDVAFLLCQAAEKTGDHAEALHWSREFDLRYQRMAWRNWLGRATAARMRLVQEALQRRAAELEVEALTDPLTGVRNRRGFDLTLPRMVATAHAVGRPLAIAVIDVDQFKAVNDEHGHQVGDEVLRRIAAVLREHCRGEDACARYGGDEFVVCLAATREDARAVVGRIQQAVASTPWNSLSPGLDVTVTVGLATLRDGDDSESVFEAADADLLASKRARKGPFLVDGGAA
jgi:diguanylate cyclase